MEIIETQDSASRKGLVNVKFRLGSETHMVDVNKGGTVVEQLVSMKEESMKILKEFITKHNVPNDVPDDLVEDPSDDDSQDVSEKGSTMSKKTKLV
ncbi:PREDICTED: uncharacterized protein LOC104824213 [Tarenaya hassleriana]|uniref:uncharacterized protein LOC104824213 n=1 Tax=Tarenaya hassleriana TaxID=28532 RepID=UPI00053C8BB0|nr:PREDICTED: uncharacterized protein LOC104824213 [Tarenaya hassleriana]XP_010554520.1 PREDICTED: uncharacterized protein LOC104824213 [Tarenaya hassleriana]